MSGTLGFVLSAVGAGRPFSEAVREAMARGYTEPDPREDLSGQDAARKGLILGRLLGYRGAPPVAEDLVPPALRKLPLAEVPGAPSLRSTRSGAGAWRRRRRAGQVLRYVVRATPHLGARPPGGGARGQPGRGAAGHAQPDLLHHPPLSHRAARDHRPRRRPAT